MFEWLPINEFLTILFPEYQKNKAFPLGYQI